MIALGAFGDGVICDLNDFLDVKKAMKQRVGDIQFHRHCLRQNSMNLFHELIEFFVSVKIIGKPEAAAPQVLVQVRNIVWAKDHLFGLDRIDERIVEDAGAGRLHQKW